ncbi:hypothetical protein JTE90_007494 [Oedothorax gibbosus]|uniref:Uncharacterized protein n=1 Tax=Oedothorax gibbosus TaxID=931172 RepID=A0AAV6VKS6_9ARAC|nr:hypothetical protein JTE90_007494 [Oedothorax gibbosus]
MFCTFSFILSIYFMRIPTLEEDTDILDLLGPGDILPDKDGSFLRRFYRKVNRVRGLDLRLKQDKSCRFYCQPAIRNHESGVGSSLQDSEASVKIYIHLCLRCLRKKGLMDKVTEYRMRRRDTLRRKDRSTNGNKRTNDYKKYATPSNQVTSPKVQTNFNPGNKKQLPHHAVFGGWISHALDKVDNKHRQEDFYKVNTKGFRKLLGRSSNPRGFLVV